MKSQRKKDRKAERKERFLTVNRLKRVNGGEVDYTGYDRTIYITGDDLEGKTVADMVARYNQRNYGKRVALAIKMSNLNPNDPCFKAASWSDVVTVYCMPCTRNPQGSLHTHYGNIDAIKEDSVTDIFGSSSGLSFVADDLDRRKLTPEEKLVEDYVVSGIPGLLAKGISAKKIASLVSRDHQARGITLEDEQWSLWRQIVDDSVKSLENRGAVGYIVPTICEELDRPLLDHILLHEAGKPIVIMMVNRKGPADTATDVTIYYGHGVEIHGRKYGRGSQDYQMNSQGVCPRIAGMKAFNLRATDVCDETLPTPAEMMTDIVSNLAVVR